MTQVSKYRLRPEVWDRIFNLFSESLLSIRVKEKFDIFLNDFLSPTERIMLAKRFATAVLVAKGNSYEEISRVLRVTSATIAKMSVRIKYGEKGINETVEEVLKKDATKLMWEEIESLFDHPTKGLSLSSYRIKVERRNIRIRRLKKEI